MAQRQVKGSMLVLRASEASPEILYQLRIFILDPLTNIAVIVKILDTNLSPKEHTLITLT